MVDDGCVLSEPRLLDEDVTVSLRKGGLTMSLMVRAPKPRLVTETKGASNRALISNTLNKNNKMVSINTRASSQKKGPSQN